MLFRSNSIPSHRWNARFEAVDISVTWNHCSAAKTLTPLLPCVCCSSSSESDMEDEDEDQDEQGEEEPPSPSDLGGVPWKEAVELHAQLKTDSDPEAGSQERVLAGTAREEEQEEERRE